MRGRSTCDSRVTLSNSASYVTFLGSVKFMCLYFFSHSVSCLFSGHCVRPVSVFAFRRAVRSIRAFGG